MPENITLDDLKENFSLFDDWEERYRYLIDLGKSLPPMDDHLKTDENKVHGCVSQVWMVTGFRDGRLEFTADSDAHIVRGLVAVLKAAYEGKTPEEIKSIDIEQAFQELGLEQHLSPNRRSGFFSMVETLRSVAGCL
jgi:cysteine desulfuration protein SufE